MTAIAVTIAGSDSSGGAGVQADLKTFSALGVYGASVLAALTAQNTQGVQGIHGVPPEFVRQQMDSIFSDLAVGAVKIGMLATPEVIETVAEGLLAHNVHTVVLDTVMVAKSGDPLLRPEAVDTLRDRLVPRAMVITPNLPEAARLLDAEQARNESEMREQAKALLALGPGAVLIKGGHSGGTEATDLLVTRDNVTRLPAKRIATRNTHGTGCTLSSAVAAELAKGQALEEAVVAAKAYLTAALGAADSLRIGLGQGPVHHFHALWPQLEGAEQ